LFSRFHSDLYRSFNPEAKPAVFTNHYLQYPFYLLPYYLPTSN